MRPSLAPKNHSITNIYKQAIFNHARHLIERNGQGGRIRDVFQMQIENEVAFVRHKGVSPCMRMVISRPANP